MSSDADLLRAFPPLAGLSGAEAALLATSALPLDLERGTLVFEPGQGCAGFPLLLAGSIRVHLLDTEGREIVLYRIARGQTCILTLASLLGQVPYAAYAVSETAVRGINLPAGAFTRLIAESDRFRNFIFAAHARRIVDLMQLVSDVAFARIQPRLARCLLERAAAGHVTLTHEALAAELGTAREVVSRHLKSLEREGCLRLAPGRVTILDARGLAARAGQAGSMP